MTAFPSPGRWAAPLLLAPALLLSACDSSYNFRSLVLEPEPDCSSQAVLLDGMSHRVLGRTGLRLNWSGCDRAGAQLASANLNGAILQGADFSNAGLEGADLSAVDGRGTRFAGADLSGAILLGSYLKGSNFRGAQLEGVDLSRVDLENADFSGATWSDGSRCAEGSIGRCVPAR